MVGITERKQNKWNETNPMFDARLSIDVHQSLYTIHIICFALSFSENVAFVISLRAVS